MTSSSPLEDEFEKRINYAKMLIRSGQVDEGLHIIEEMEQQYGPSLASLPPGARYLIPFSRGRAYLQTKQASLALAQFRAAVELAGSDIEARARSQNLLGATLYAQEQPSAALRCHQECVGAIVRGPIKDLTFKLSVYQNLANDYWALNDLANAIGSYREALRVLKNLDLPERQADIYWGLSAAHKILKEWRYARMYAKRAIQLFHTTGNRAAEAAMHINFAEILLEEGRTAQAEHPLETARELLAGTNYNGLWSFVYRYSADVARRLGDLAQATLYGEESIKYAEALFTSEQPADSHVWVDPNRTCAEALHGAALVEEAKGEPAVADMLFSRAFKQLENTTLWEIKRAILLSYAAILEARGDYIQAVEHYKAANKPDIDNPGEDDEKPEA